MCHLAHHSPVASVSHPTRLTLETRPIKYLNFCGKRPHNQDEDEDQNQDEDQVIVIVQDQVQDQVQA